MLAEVNKMTKIEIATLGDLKDFFFSKNEPL